ncbi:MAG: glycosyltransferase 87 family protein [Mycobacterium sp.]
MRRKSLAPYILALSITISAIGNTLMGPHFCDLHTLVIQSARLTTGHLYDINRGSGDVIAASNLVGTFMYPPFAAMVLYPLHFLPMCIVESMWFAATVAAWYGCIRVTQKLIGKGDQRSAMLWTAASLWFEPVVNVLCLGQVGVFLALAVLYAAYTTRDAVSGTLVGIAAGFKLTPAVTWFYFLGQQRYKALAVSMAVFAATLGIGFVAFHDLTVHYLSYARFGDATRVDYAGAINQSWLGVLSRILGYSAGGTLVLNFALAATVILSIMAWRRTSDALGRLLVIQLCGLLISPISWTNHWVWLVPLVMWLFTGPGRSGSKIVGAAWIALMLVQIPNGLEVLQTDITQIGRPWYLAWGATVYLAGAIATLTWIVLSKRTPVGERARPKVLQTS